MCVQEIGARGARRLHADHLCVERERERESSTSVRVSIYLYISLY